MTEAIVFFCAAALMLTGAVGVIASKNPVHSALFLIQTLLGVAIIFVLQEAHFLAAVQVVVYAGAIVILFLFVIMLLGVDKAEELDVEPIGGHRPLAAIAGAGLLAAGLAVMLIAVDGATGRSPQNGVGGELAETSLDNRFTDVERIGRVLFSDYALAFEITAALLTIAVIGAVVLTRGVRADELMDDLDPAPMTVPDPAPEGSDGESSA